MAFYQQDPEMAFCLKGLLDRFEKEGYPNLQKNIAITWIRYENQKPSSSNGYGTGLNSSKNFYPASVVKIVYALATEIWITKDLIVDSSEIRRALHEMIKNSNNDATSLILDLLTGTTSGPSLNEPSFKSWIIQRQLVNNWLNELQWPELKTWNCNQKTWNEGPFGREKDFYGPKNENRNSMTTDGIARIFEALMTNEMLSKASSERLKSIFQRSLDPLSRKKDFENQVDGFLGEGLPLTAKLWSKAGLMSEVRHDVAWWVVPDRNPMLLAVFTTGNKLVKDQFILPAISSELNKLAI
tara:strand:+ start:1552 stop:2445 length:894 start_codon:yes stop_codon:yes gene_type:complete